MTKSGLNMEVVFIARSK